jgi:hypothetical protein
MFACSMNASNAEISLSNPVRVMHVFVFLIALHCPVQVEGFLLQGFLENVRWISFSRYNSESAEVRRPNPCPLEKEQ